MIFERTLKNLITEYFDENAQKVDYYLNFNFENEQFRIAQVSPFKYVVYKNKDISFTGNFFSLVGYLKGLKQYFNPNNISVRNPKVLNGFLENLIKDKNPIMSSEYIKLNDLFNKTNKQLNDNISQKKAYKSELKKCQESLRIKNLELEQLKKKADKEISQLKSDNEEAANLISDLYYKKEDIEFGTKHYKLENFPKDAREFIQDIIKEYYNKV